MWVHPVRRLECPPVRAAPGVTRSCSPVDTAAPADGSFDQEPCVRSTAGSGVRDSARAKGISYAGAGPRSLRVCSSDSYLFRARQVISAVSVIQAGGLGVPLVGHP